jgi:hypothetical protein
VKTAAQKRENADNESVMTGEAAKRPLPAKGKLVLGFIGQVKSVFNHQKHEFPKEHISRMLLVSSVSQKNLCLMPR